MEPPRPRRPRPLRVKLGFSLLLVLLAVGGLEGGLRLLGWPTSQVRTIAWLLEDDPQRFASAVGVFRAGAAGRVAWPKELAYEVRINSLGLRGEELARTPPPGTKRILALGDSGTFGFYVAEDQTMPARLQALLRAQGLAAEVVNGGCGGWSIDSQTLFLEGRALALAPHLVLLVYCSNDIADLRAPEPSFVTMQATRGRREWLRSTALHELAWRLKSALREPRPHPLSSDGLEPAERDALWASYREWLTRLAGVLRARGVPLVVLYQPDAWKLQQGLPASDEELLRAACAEAGAELISPLPAFTGRPVTETFLLPLDPHPSALGYQLEAEVAAQHLLAHRARLGL